MLNLQMRRHDISHLRLDANEGVFFARQLEHIQATIYRTLYAELSAFRLFPTSGEAGPAAKTITYRAYDKVGAARIIAGYGDDLPRVGVTGKEVTSNVRSIGASYGWSIQDIRSAMMANVNLSNELAMAAVSAHNVITNDIAFNGDAAHGLDGLKTLSDIPSAAATTGAWIATATADQIIADVNEALREIITTSKGVHRPNTVAMPVAQYAHIASTPRTSGTDTTILEFLRRVWPGVAFEQATELEDWSGSDDALIAYQRDSAVVELMIPQPYEELPAQPDNLEFKVPTHSRVGGLVVRFPKAFNIKTGI